MARRWSGVTAFLGSFGVDQARHLRRSLDGDGVGVPEALPVIEHLGDGSVETPGRRQYYPIPAGRRPRGAVGMRR